MYLNKQGGSLESNAIPKESSVTHGKKKSNIIAKYIKLNMMNGHAAVRQYPWQ